MFGLEQSGHFRCRLWALLGHSAAGHHQTLQGLHRRWAHPHTLTPAQPHTHSEEPATPNPSLPSLLQVCGEQKTDHRAARCPADLGQGCLQGEQRLGCGGGTAQFVLLMGQSTHVPGPQLCPEKLCHWTGQAQTSLSSAESAPITLPSLSQPTRQAVT